MGLDRHYHPSIEEMSRPAGDQLQEMAKRLRNAKAARGLRNLGQLAGSKKAQSANIARHPKFRQMQQDLQSNLPKHEDMRQGRHLKGIERSTLLWKYGFCNTLNSLLSEVMLTDDPDGRLNHLDRVYDWYCKQRHIPGTIRQEMLEPAPAKNRFRQKLESLRSPNLGPQPATPTNRQNNNNAFGGQNVLGQAGFLGKPLPGSSFYEPETKKSARRGRDDIPEEDNLEFVYEDDDDDDLDDVQWIQAGGSWSRPSSAYTRVRPTSAQRPVSAGRPVSASRRVRPTSAYDLHEFDMPNVDRNRPTSAMVPNRPQSAKPPTTTRPQSAKSSGMNVSKLRFAQGANVQQIARPNTASTALPPPSSARPSSAFTSRPASAYSLAARPSSAHGGRPGSAVRPDTARTISTGLWDSRPGTATVQRPDSALSDRNAVRRHEQEQVQLLADKMKTLEGRTQRMAEDRGLSIAQFQMEQRWLKERHSRVAEDERNEDQRSYMDTWAQRRTKVEEDQIKNAEARRVASITHRRAYKQPKDCEVDIEIDQDGNVIEPQETVQEDNKEEQKEETPRPVSNQKRDPRSTTPVEVSVTLNLKKEDHGANRIARARQLAKPYLHKDEDVKLPTKQDSTKKNYAVTLSPYGQEDPTEGAGVQKHKHGPFPCIETEIDVLSSVCTLWQTKNELSCKPDSKLTFEAQRAEQLEGVNAIRNHFYEKTGSVPIANSVLKNALVIPRHELKPNVGYLNSVPGLMIDPFYVPPQVGKKKKGKKGGGGKKKK